MIGVAPQADAQAEAGVAFPCYAVEKGQFLQEGSIVRRNLVTGYDSCTIRVDLDPFEHSLRFTLDGTDEVGVLEGIQGEHLCPAIALGGYGESSSATLLGVFQVAGPVVASMSAGMGKKPSR